MKSKMITVFTVRGNNDELVTEDYADVRYLQSVVPGVTVTTQRVRCFR